MQRVGNRFVYAASDLNDYLACKRLAEYDALVARGAIGRPEQDDPQAELIRRKGDEHERRYLERLRTTTGDANVRAFGRSENSIEAFERAEAQTLEAMISGVATIYQATFFDGTFLGRADFLRRVETPSKLGEWSYEVLDTKLALNPKPYFLIQLCNYSEHLTRLQGSPPAFGAIVLGDGSERRFAMADYAAYYRRLRRRFLAFLEDPARSAALEPLLYPFVCAHCATCEWDPVCTARRVTDDHLSGVAGIRRDQIEKLEAAGIPTLAALAIADDRPVAMAADTFAKLRRQAALQLRSRTENAPVYELLEHAAPFGFTQLPQADPGDVFFDMEGDPLYEPGRGLEYLFGAWMPADDPPFRAFWGTDRAGERAAFESFVDFVVARRARYPGLHVYHYASYEKTALRRLAQVHRTREAEVDDLLRGEVLVDLFAVVRQALSIGEDGYGLKKIERYYGLERVTDVRKGDQSIVEFERWLEHPEDRTILQAIEDYNRDDCRSTFLLREWLLRLHDEAQARFGIALPFREARRPDQPCHSEYLAGCKTCETRRTEEREEARRSELERELLANVLFPETQDEYAAMAPRSRTRYLLANLLAYHRREEKPKWWQYFDRCENLDRLREFDRDAIGELRRLEDVPPFKASPRDRKLAYTFAFPEQFHKMAPNARAHDPARKAPLEIITLAEDGERRTIAIKCRDEDAARCLTAVIPGPPLATKEQRASLARIAQAFVNGTLETAMPASFALLSNAAPRIAGAAPGADVQPSIITAQAVSQTIGRLDRSVLFVQGPPGSGKTTTAAYVIADLLQAGKRVGITSTGHKAIQNLVGKVESEMRERGASFRGLYKHSAEDSRYVSPLAEAFVTSTSGNDDFADPGVELAAGTSWLFSREEMAGRFDFLFVDEAGQVSLADALAMSPSARNLVPIGDPSQLAQVSTGIHPPGAGDSVLQHVLGEATTVPKNRGIFLDRSYRMQPAICAFISDVMYGGRLEPAPETTRHRILQGEHARRGLEFLAVPHAGNASQSQPEADAIAAEILALKSSQVVDSDGSPRPFRDHDAIVVTPYNAQRRLLTQTFERLGLHVEVGTVDKFQGRQAAVVFYSMATSSEQDAPRDAGFLFERNRFNVAVSRARALSVLVCSPDLLDSPCRTPEQMALVNLLCEFVDRAEPVAVRAEGSPSPRANIAG